MTGPDRRDRRDDWPSEMRRPEPKPADPRSPSDDLAAEIALHTPSRVGRSCYRCGEDWPCLVARLARERDGARPLALSDEEHDLILTIRRAQRQRDASKTPDGEVSDG